MPKKKISPFLLGSPKTDNPIKEMSWCLAHHIKVNIEPEAVKEDGYWKMTMRYQIVVSQGNRKNYSGYIFNKDNVTDAVFDAYRNIYQRNHAKKKEE